VGRSHFFAACDGGLEIVQFIAIFIEAMLKTR
jgi:hypothetical protein